jgi:putative glutathione S-transferase
MPRSWLPAADLDRGRNEPPWGPPPARRPAPGASDLTRRQGSFTGQITRDGSSGFPVEAGRYQLYASLACPWSQRALIVCRLLGLDRVIGLTLTDPVTDENGWRLGDRGPGDPGPGDPLTGARYLADLYRATDPGYPGPYTLPLIWDQRTRSVVTNDVTDITVMLETEFRQYHRPGSPDLYPLTRRRDIESLATLIHHTVNDGVYRAGQATDQASYDQAVDALFTTFDALEERLAGRRFLLGAQLTETDIRLYPTLARFDAVYYQLFNCNLRRLTDYPHLWGYARDLFSQPGFGETTDLDQIKRHYYLSSEWDNRSHIVPIGPLINWKEPHGRARLSA